MKRLLLCVLFLFLFASGAQAESFELAAPLEEYIYRYGLFDGSRGVIYASFEKLQPPDTSLFVAYANDNKLHCAVFDNTDGVMLTDELSFENDTAVALGKCTDGSGCIIAKGKCFVMRDDKFTLYAGSYKKTKNIMASRNKKIITYSNTNSSLTHFLNSLKLRGIRQCRYPNVINTLSTEKKRHMHDVISACADIMEYDAENYNFDELFCRVLNTHKNFEILTDIAPLEAQRKIGEESVCSINAEFMDDIMRRYMGIIPERPPVNLLLQRGFCYSGGMYYYRKKYNVEFATEMGDFTGIYDLGNNLYYCVFYDTYIEGKTKKPEYSFCILKEYKSDIRPVRIGMGKPFPSDYTLKRYADKFSEYEKYRAAPEGKKKFSENIGALIAAASAILVFLVIRRRL